MTARSAIVWFAGVDNEGWDAAYAKQCELRDSGDWRVVTIQSEEKPASVGFTLSFYDTDTDEFVVRACPSQIRLITTLREFPHITRFDVERRNLTEQHVYVLYF